MKYKVVNIGIGETRGPIFNLYNTRADAVHAIRACATPEAFQIVQTAPDDMDVDASTAFYVQADVARYVIRSCSVEEVDTLVQLFGSRYALLEALDVDTNPGNQRVEIAERALTLAFLGNGTPAARALVYLIIWFADREYAEGLGADLDPTEAYCRLDRDVRERVRPVFKAWLDGR